MDKIKSAYEMAMERFKQRKEVPEEEIEKMEYLPAGQALAANFLREDKYDLTAAINNYPEQKRGYVIEGIVETFLNNIFLPDEAAAKKLNERVKEGLLLIKKDRRAVEEVFKQLDNLFHYYEQAVSQTYSQFKESFTMKLNASLRSMEKRVGARLKVDPEKHPGFREEWMRVVNRLNDQYQAYIEEQKIKLRNTK